MIQKTAVLLVLVFSMAASARLACEWTCEDAAAAHHAAPCHDTGISVLVNGTSHQCNHDTLGPVSTTAKNTVFQQSGALVSAVVPQAASELTPAPSQRVALPSGAHYVPHSPLNSVLRI